MTQHRNAHSLLFGFVLFVITVCFSHSLEFRSRDAEAQGLDKSYKLVLEPAVPVCPLPDLCGACVNVLRLVTLGYVSIQVYNIPTRRNFFIMNIYNNIMVYLIWSIISNYVFFKTAGPQSFCYGINYNISDLQISFHNVVSRSISRDLQE